MNSLKYPNMREELVSYLQELSNQGDQEYSLSGGKNVSISLKYSIHFFFDDTPLGDKPELCIGVFLRNKKEAYAIAQVTKSLDSLIDLHGADLTDSEYLGKPEWNEVVSTAASALSVFCEK